MGSLDFNVHLQSNFVSYLNDAPFLQLYIIWLYEPSSNPWICKQHQHDFSHILIESYVRCSDKMWHKSQQGFGNLFIGYNEAVQISNDCVLRITLDNKNLETKDRAAIGVWSQNALDLIPGPPELNLQIQLSDPQSSHL